MAKNILVTGATGKQGSALIAALLAAPSAAKHVIYAVTRSPESAAAQRLASTAGVEIVKGDLDHPAAIFAAVGKPIWGVFSVQVPFGGGATAVTEERQGKELIDAALAHGHVKQFVYTSAERGGVASITNPTEVPHFISKYNIEHHLIDKAKQAGMGYTVLRPVAFMDNLTNDFFGKVFATSWKICLPRDKPLQLIATADVGQIAAQALLNPTSPEYANAQLGLAGDSLTYAEASAIFQEQTGKAIPTTFEALARGVMWGVKDFGIMFKWIGRDGFGANVPALRQDYPDLLTFKDWLRKYSNWKS